MPTMLSPCVFLASLIAFLSGGLVSAAPPEASKSQSGESFPPGWSARAPRDEIRPAFSFEEKGRTEAVRAASSFGTTSARAWTVGFKTHSQSPGASSFVFRPYGS